MQPCPCGTKKNYSNCCKRFINGIKKPGTPEELMRSRYTAYTQGNIEYILKTMKEPASNNFDVKSAQKWATTVKCLELDVIKTSINHAKGYVEFIAHFNEQGKNSRIHEISEFHQINDEWYYSVSDK